MFGQDDILDGVYSDVANQNELPMLQQHFLGVIASNCSNLAVLESRCWCRELDFRAFESPSPCACRDGQEDDRTPMCGVKSARITTFRRPSSRMVRDKFAAYTDVMEYCVLDAKRKRRRSGFR